MDIEQIREWLENQKSERMPGEGIRHVARETGIHENTLYGICRGSKPQAPTVEKLRQLIESRGE